MNRPYQRKGSKSNTDVGNTFKEKVKIFFESQEGITLTRNISVDIGIRSLKPHKFDLGNLQEKILIECKSHKWTQGGNVPSSKIIAWDQAMFYFHLLRGNYRKIFCVLRDYNIKKDETLAQYYIRTKEHLIPCDVEIWELDEEREVAERIR